MSFLQLAKEQRYSVREFSARAVEKEKLKQCTSSHFNAPLALMICYDKTTVWKNKTNDTIGGDVDASIVTTQMMLEDAELGLATTWVGAFDHRMARELFDIDHTVFYNYFDGITEGEAHRFRR